MRLLIPRVYKMELHGRSESKKTGHAGRQRTKLVWRLRRIALLFSVLLCAQHANLLHSNW